MQHQEDGKRKIIPLLRKKTVKCKKHSQSVYHKSINIQNLNLIFALNYILPFGELSLKK